MGQYLATLARLKEERAELKERNEFLEEKIRKDKEQHKREERLLHSAFYEVRQHGRVTSFDRMHSTILIAAIRIAC